MANLEALGAKLNVIPTADAVEVTLRDSTGVTFVCTGADTYTVEECTDAAGTGAQSLAKIDHYYTNTSAAGAAAWAKATQNVGAAVTIASGIAVIEISEEQLSDGYAYVRCTSTSSGLVTAITHGLKTQRSPELLAALAV